MEYALFDKGFVFQSVLGFPIKLTKTILSRVSGKMRKHFSVWAILAVLSSFKQVFSVFQAQKPSKTNLANF
jgi:hypothetical protein